MTTYPPATQARLDLERAVQIEVDAFAVHVALSLTQPWATLMALDAKRVETRGWRTGHRGWLGIHASKGFPVACRDLCQEDPFATALHRAGFLDWKDLPIGGLLGVTNLIECARTEHARDHIGQIERAFGDYSDGRFAWSTYGFRRLRQAIPMKGALSLWKMPRPITLADLQ